MPLVGNLNGYVQLQYNSHPNQGVPGQITFLQYPRENVHCPVGSEFVVCGRAVVRGDVITNTPNRWGTTISPWLIEAPTASSTAEDVVGILVRDDSAYNGPGLAVNDTDADFAVGYYQTKVASYCRLGYIHVKNYADTTAGDPVYMVINETNTFNAKIGEFIPTEVAGVSIEIPGLTWWSSDLNSENATSIVKVNLSYPNTDTVPTP